MSQEVSGNKLIAKNATMLYVRMFFTLAISFYSSRIILLALGVSDYGIYNVVGGVISLISVLTNSLGTATSRFLTFSLGKDNLHKLKITFSAAFFIHVLLALIFLILAETIGLWFVNTQLIIPDGRMVAANWVYQAAILSTVMSITQVPYDASINSHEKMGAFAYLQIANAVLKLGIAFLVLYSPYDHLILYSILYVSLAISLLLYYRYYCIKNFPECSLILIFDKFLFKKMMSFSMWSLVGNVSETFKDQGLNVLLNRFFGTLLNAAAGVAGQVMGILSAFAGNITIAFRPQIVKEYAVGNFNRFNYLINMGTKFQTIVCILSIAPILFNLNFLMHLWLVEVPDGAIILCQILLINTIFFSLNPFVYYGIVATGQIRNVNIALGIICVIFIGLFYFVLRLTHSYVQIYVLNLLASPIYTAIYVVILKKELSSFNVKTFVLGSLAPLLVIGASACILAWIVNMIPIHPILQLLLSLMVCSSFTGLVSYRFLLGDNERSTCHRFIENYLHIRKQKR